MNAICASPSPGVALSAVGGPAFSNGVTDSAFDAALDHTVLPEATLTARNCTLYDVPAVRPGIVTGLVASAGLSDVQLVPPSVEYW